MLTKSEGRSQREKGSRQQSTPFPTEHPHLDRSGRTSVSERQAGKCPGQSDSTVLFWQGGARGGRWLLNASEKYVMRPIVTRIPRLWLRTRVQSGKGSDTQAEDESKQPLPLLFKAVTGVGAGLQVRASYTHTHKQKTVFSFPIKALG